MNFFHFILCTYNQRGIPPKHDQAAVIVEIDRFDKHLVLLPFSHI